MDDKLKESESRETGQIKPNQIFIGFVILGILIIALMVFTYYSTSNLNTKIESVNNSLNSLELGSEDHFIQVQNDMVKSIVMVRSSPAHSDTSSADNVIFLDNNGQAWNLGTGFSIDDNGDILTANHVVSDSNLVFVDYNDDQNVKTFTVYAIRHVPELDLAILYVNTSIPKARIQSLNSSYKSSEIGSSIAFIGFPMTTILDGKSIPVQTTVKGSVSSIIPFTYKNEKVPVLILGGTANHGNSGGPVFSLKTGEVIGMINQKIEGTEGITISTAIYQELINNLLQLDTS